jgi:hypothetical protein
VSLSAQASGQAPSSRGAGGAAAQGAQARSARVVARPLGVARRLRDGTPVWIRPLVAADRDQLLAGFGRLSGASRHSRFGHAVSDGQFERMLPVLLDTVDQQAHVALVLYSAAGPIGVGRLRRYANEWHVADLAVTVADDWQSLGAGTLLAREVLGRTGGIREIRTVVGGDNPASLSILAGLGELRSSCVAGSCEVTVLVSPAGAAATVDAAA